MNSRFDGLTWITHKQAWDMSDVHEHVKSMVMPDIAALTEEHKVPYIPAMAAGAILGKLTGAGIGSVKRTPWTHKLEFKPSWRGSGWGATFGGLAGGSVGLLAAYVVNKIREKRKEKEKEKV